MSKIIETLSGWESVAGEGFETVVSDLARNANALIFDASAQLYDDNITYTLTLTNDGINFYGNWINDQGFTSDLKNGRVLEFEDIDPASINATLEEWSVSE